MMAYSRNSLWTQPDTDGIDGPTMDAWLRARGPAGAKVVDLPYREPPAGTGQAVIDECKPYGINPVLKMAQIAHETASLQSHIVRDKNNPSGIGAVNDNAYEGAHTYETLQEGIRASVAHLMGYLAGDGPWNARSPRYELVKKAGNAGTVRTLADLEQKWAWSPPERYNATPANRRYGGMIAAKANDLVAFTKSRGEELPVSDAQIPGFKWHPADRDHYQPGRTTKIRGGAQHYTAGTNSLNWLTTTPGTQVSATFLVKHNPTLEDRGWQLVRIEDTAWTTAFANPYTVSIEYEHTGKGPIPDAAYAVLAQTWRDIAAYVERHNLGKITPDAASLKGHKDWVGNPGLTCPDGIDVDRIIREWKALITETDALVIAGNPYDAKLVFGFRDMFLRVGAALYPDDPIAGGLTVFGYPMDDEYPTATGSAQVFERVVMQWHRDTPPPFDVVASLRNEPIPEPVEDAA